MGLEIYGIENGLYGFCYELVFRFGSGRCFIFCTKILPESEKPQTGEPGFCVRGAVTSSKKSFQPAVIMCTGRTQVRLTRRASGTCSSEDTVSTLLPVAGSSLLTATATYLGIFIWPVNID
jgi:hypothetical protein